MTVAILSQSLNYALITDEIIAILQAVYEFLTLFIIGNCVAGRIHLQVGEQLAKNHEVISFIITLISILERLRDRATQISNIAYHEQVRAPSVLFVTLQHNIANVNKFTCDKISYQADFSH